MAYTQRLGSVGLRKQLLNSPAEGTDLGWPWALALLTLLSLAFILKRNLPGDLCSSNVWTVTWEMERGLAIASDPGCHLPVPDLLLGAEELWPHQPFSNVGIFILQLDDRRHSKWGVCFHPRYSPDWELSDFSSSAKSQWYDRSMFWMNSGHQGSHDMQKRGLPELLQHVARMSGYVFKVMASISREVNGNVCFVVINLKTFYHSLYFLIIHCSRL